MRGPGSIVRLDEGVHKNIVDTGMMPGFAGSWGDVGRGAVAEWAGGTVPTEERE